MMWQPRRNHRDMQNREDCIMRILENIEPKSVFHFFEDLTEIPRPSFHEKAVSDYLVKFAKDR